MSSQENASPEDQVWHELKLPDILFKDPVREVHARIQHEWDSLRHSACQTAAGRALWKHVTNDPVADLLAGETYLKSFYEKIKKDRINNAREISGVILAVRTLWFDSKLEAALSSFDGIESQVVLLGAGMDSRSYRLSCLKDCDVYEVDFPEVLQVKTTLLKAAMESPKDHRHLTMTAKSVIRVAADIRGIDWLEKVQVAGFAPEKNTVWVLEGIIYYLFHSQAMQVLETIADKCTIAHTVLLADFMKNHQQRFQILYSTFTVTGQIIFCRLLAFLMSIFHRLVSIFGLMRDPLNPFNKLRSLPRSVQTHPDDGKLCCRLYLVQASGSPNPSTS